VHDPKPAPISLLTAWRLRCVRVLSDGRHRLHLVGFSHGSKVIALAGLLLEKPPEHLTLLDSPEGLLPVIGGALNDLTPYLRPYNIGRDQGQTFVDSYPSRYGVNHGEHQGVGDVTEVTLDPASHPLVTATNPHAYAHSWYHASGNRDVGLAWSPLFADGTAPAVRQLRQVDEDLPWTLEPNPDVSPAQPVAELVERVVQRRGEPIRLSTESRRTFWVVRWRHPGEFVATSRVRWLSGPPDAEISLIVQGMERWRSRKGWSDDPVRKAVIPLGGLRPGAKITRLRLDSPEPGEVEVQRAAVGGVPIPSLSELQSWVGPAVRTFVLPFTMLAGPTAWRLARTAVGCAARVQSLLSRKTFVVDDEQEPEQDQSAEAKSCLASKIRSRRSSLRLQRWGLRLGRWGLSGHRCLCGWCRSIIITLVHHDDDEDCNEDHCDQDAKNGPKS
jgi:hypothetical protein